MSVSPNNQFIAYSIDTDGGERFTLHVIDLTNGIAVTSPITHTIGEAIWNQHSDGLLYRHVNEQWRPDKIYWRNMTTKHDTLICAEEDGGFFLSMHLSQSEQLVFLRSADHVTSEVSYLPIDDFSATPVMISPRSSGHEYDVEHYQDQLLIRSNLRQPNFDLFTAPLSAHSQAQWQPFLEGDDNHYLVGHLVYENHVFVPQRVDGLDQILVIDERQQQHCIELPEATYSLDLGTNPSYQSAFLRLQYSSLTTPNSVLDYDLASRTLQTRKVQHIPSGYDAQQYQSERLTATARDGKQVPISLVYHRNTPLDGSAPLHLYAYGAYGYAVPQHFPLTSISFDRGIIFAIAHIRGGDDLGYHWYQDGKLQQRENTFNDFVDCTHHLKRLYRGRQSTDQWWQCRWRVDGGSHQSSPQLYAAVAAHVPFVDVLNTMLNADLP